jgi:hypothetical protein
LDRFFQGGENPVVALGLMLPVLITIQPESPVNGDKHEKKLRHPMQNAGASTTGRVVW